MLAVLIVLRPFPLQFREKLICVQVIDKFINVLLDVKTSVRLTITLWIL